MAEAVGRALAMPREERCQRMRSLRKVVSDHDIYVWAHDIMRTLLEVETPPAAYSLPESMTLASGAGW
jgi:trehalose-6-phosphate synthase